MKAIYLKKQLQTNIPMKLILRKRGGSYPEKDYNTGQPTGKNTFLYTFADVNGNEMKHYAKEREEEVLKLFQEGESVTVTLKETMKKTPQGEKRIGYLDWTAPGDASESVQQLRPNVAQKTLEKKAQEYKEKDDVKQVMISLAGLTQAFIAGGEKDIEKAIASAVSAREKILKKAQEIVSVGCIEPITATAPVYETSIKPEDLPF